MTEQVLTENREGILQITLNRPEKKNALNAAMYNVMSDVTNESFSLDQFRRGFLYATHLLQRLR